MAKFIQRQQKALAEIAAKTPHLRPFSDDNPAARAERIARVQGEGWEAFSYFCVAYFPHVFGKPFCAIHQEMFQETEYASGVIGITGFRGLGKTVLMGVVYPIWCVIRGERYVIHTAADVDLAEERTAFTLHELQNNRRLLSDWPELEPMDVDKADFYLKNKARIRARSIKQSHRGTINPRTAKRPGLIVCDDIDKEENMGSQTIGKRKMDKITQELAGALDPSEPGKVIWLGNLVHPNYAICQFQEMIIGELKAEGLTTEGTEKSREKQRERQDGTPTLEMNLDTAKVLKTSQRALLRYSLEDAEGMSTWPEQYPDEQLPELRKRYGFSGYQREMLGQPVIEGNIFKNDWFKRYKSLPDPSKVKRVWLYADPAWGEKGCYKAVISIGYDGSRFYVINVWIRQTENTKFFRYYYDAYLELDRTYRVKMRAACETTFGQARILTDFDRWATDNHLPPISHRIKRIDNKENKNLRIERTETPIETAKVLFPEGQDMPTLVSQFCTYPDGYVDGPDALAGCLERFNEYDVGRNRVRVRRMQW